MTERRFEAGEIIFREGDPADFAYLIHSGRVEILKETGVGALTLAMLEGGDMFGEMGVLDATGRSATARAVEPVTASVIDHAALLAMFVCRPRDSLAVLRALIKRLRAMNRWIAAVVPAAGGDRAGARVTVEIAADRTAGEDAPGRLALEIGPHGARLRNPGGAVAVNGVAIGGGDGCDTALLRPGANEVVAGTGKDALRLTVHVDRGRAPAGARDRAASK